MKSDQTNQHDRRWPLWKLAVLLYVFVSGALAINLFMIGLMAQITGLPNLPPVTAIIVGLILGIPGSWVAARWVQSLMDEAEDGS